jgi:hypothetical protein
MSASSRIAALTDDRLRNPLPPTADEHAEPSTRSGHPRPPAEGRQAEGVLRRWRTSRWTGARSRRPCADADLQPATASAIVRPRRRAAVRRVANERLRLTAFVGGTNRTRSCWGVPGSQSSGAGGLLCGDRSQRGDDEPSQSRHDDPRYREQHGGALRGFAPSWLCVPSGLLAASRGCRRLAPRWGGGVLDQRRQFLGVSLPNHL